MHINKEETRHYSEMADQILNIIKEHERVKATEIAYILGTNRRTVNHYLYSELSGIVLKDDDHYWAQKGTRLFQTTDGIYYLTEYIPKALRHYKSDEALEDSRLIKLFFARPKCTKLQVRNVHLCMYILYIVAVVRYYPDTLQTFRF